MPWAIRRVPPKSRTPQFIRLHKQHGCVVLVRRRQPSKAGVPYGPMAPSQGIAKVVSIAISFIPVLEDIWPNAASNTPANGCTFNCRAQDFT